MAVAQRALRVRAAQPLPVKLLMVVFAIYLTITFVITLIQLVLEYREMRQTVEQELMTLEEAFLPALRAALRIGDREQIDSLIEGIKHLPVVVGIDFLDYSGRVIAQFQSDNTHDFSINNNTDGRLIHLADVKFYSNSLVVIDRIKYTFFILIMSVVIESVALWLLFAWVFKRYLADPLNRLVAQMSVIDPSQISQQRINLEVNEDHEFKAVERAVNPILAAINQQKKSLLELEKRSQNQLEVEVLERTSELQQALQAAESARHEAVKAQQEADRANLSKTEFLANMSHELRTPMHGILSFSNFGIKRYESAEREKLGQYFYRIQQSGERLLQLLNNLLDLSQLEAGRMEFKLTKTNFVDLVDLVVQEQQARIHERKLCVTVQSHKPFELYIDEGRIVQVLVNLLSNAIKFTPLGGELRIRICPDQILQRHPERGGVFSLEAVRFALEDNGVGIPANELESIFDKFIQSSKTKSNSGGTGLGLAICREIIEGHGGRIWAENGAQGGALFQFVLPLRQPQTTA